MKLGTNIILTTKAHSDLDAFYGPYEATELKTALLVACEAVIPKFRALGLTVGIINSAGKVEEYLWKTNDLSDAGLKPKVEDYELTIDSVSHTTNTEKNEITFTVTVAGKGFGVLTNIYLGSTKITSVPTLLNLSLTVTITAPENPGNYIYTIAAIDSILGNGTQSTHEVIWKEVDIKINPTSSLYTYLVKSLSNVRNAEFTFLIYKIDTLQIDTIQVLYGANNSFSLYNRLLGDDYSNIYNVNIGDLSNLQSGDLIRLKVDGANLTLPFIKEVVQLTAPGVYAQCQGTIPATVFNGLSFSATFRFEAENVGNYQVAIKDNGTTVYNSSLLSYSTNTLTIKLNDSTLSPSKLSSQHTLEVYIEDSLQPNYTFSTVTLMYVSSTEQLEDIDADTHFLDGLDFNLTEGRTLSLLSYILDLVCYIPFTDDTSTLFLFGNITINKDMLLFRNITYPVPILKEVSIGFMCNVKSPYQNEDFYYDALFIDGVLCKKYPHDSSNPSGITITSEGEGEGESTIDLISNKIRLYYNTNQSISQSPENFVLERNYKARNPEAGDTSNLPIFTITPVNNIVTLANLTDELKSLVANNKITINGTEYSVINDTKYKVGTFGNLGDNKYNIDTIINSFCTAYGISDLNQLLDGETKTDKDNRILAALKKLVKKNPSKIPNDFLTLTRQIVESKSLLQKYVGVPCQWSYGGNTGYLVAFTQGTSTLEYALPNFTFKFYTDTTFSTTTNVSIIPKISRTLDNILSYSNEVDSNTQFYSEKELVAKADYMESSHLNNTPTAMFYNAITTLQTGYNAINENGKIVQSGGVDVKILQNPVAEETGTLNAIEGIPIILEINSMNYGSFMLNIGKTGKSIGFGEHGISLEGTSNDDTYGLSSRFDFSSIDTAAKTYLEGILDINSVTTVNSDFVAFLKGGLEYRYSGNNLDEIGDNEGTEQSPAYSEYLRILKMWYWVYTHEVYTKEQFEEMFNFDFAALYYILMMIFGQTDNLGKNCMFDLFTENGQWYVRPYDMDSLAGLDNNGYDNLTPVIEISQRFVLDEATKDVTLISYLGQNTPRFPYSSKTSNLWIRFYNNLRPDIETFYGYLRRLGYSAEAVINLCKTEVIDKLKINQYNIDFLNKYLSNKDSDQQFAYGNRWFKFLDWILKRFDFCDTYFGYNVYDAGTFAGVREFNIKFALPQYFLYKYKNIAGATITNWGTEIQELKFESTTKLTVWFSPKYITDDDGIFYDGFSYMNPRVKLNNLVKYNGNWSNLCNVVDLSENTYLQSATISNISTTGDGYIPTSVKVLNINSSNLIPLLRNLTNLEQISFSGCEGNIYLENCPNLKTINISSPNRVNLTLINCGTETSYTNLNINSTKKTSFNLIVLNGSYINYLNLANLQLNLSFTGAKSYVKIVNLYNATITNGELNITNLMANALILNSIGTVRVVTTEAKSFNFLGLDRSSITLWGTTANTFDGNYVGNVNTVRMIEVDSITALNNIITLLNANSFTSNIYFRLRRCTKIQYVINLNIDSTGTYLFAECLELKSVTNSNIKASGQYMFYRCYNLETLPTSSGASTITLADTNGLHMFNSCLKLAYADIVKVLQNNQVSKYWNSSSNTYQDAAISGVSSTLACKLTNYNAFMYNKSHSSNVTIDLSLYAFATTMANCFCIYTFDLTNPTTNKNTETNVTLTVNGKLSKAVTTVYLAFASDTIHRYIVDSNIFDGCALLTNLDYCFAKNGTDEYYFEAPVLPNNSRMTLNRMFSGSKVDITNLKTVSTIYLPSNTRLCYSMFNNATLSEVIEVSQIFSNCILLEEVMNCFRNCKNFTSTSTVRFTSSSYVNIAGLFADNPSNSVKYGFTGLWYSDPSVDNYLTGDAVKSTMSSNNRVGPYYNTTVQLSDPSITISNTTRPMRNVLDGAIIDNSLGSMNLVLDVTTKNCNEICRRLKLKDISDTVTKLEVNMTSVEQASNAFNGVKILKTDNPISIPTSLINGQYMFANSNITLLPDLHLCTGLKNISNMFQNCENLEDVLPTTHYFLPISVTNINYLFDGCLGLHGGIPENFIQTIDNGVGEEPTRTSLTELIWTFGSTSILLSNADPVLDGYALDISTMFPEVTNVTGLFYYLTSKTYTAHRQSLSSQCFSKCITCDHLFNSSWVTIPLNCDFTSAESMRFAFAYDYSTSYVGARETLFNRGLTNILIGTRTDISGIFAVISPDNAYSEVTNNLLALLGLKNVTLGVYTGMLYGYSNDTSKEEFRAVTEPNTARRILTYTHA